MPMLVVLFLNFCMAQLHGAGCSRGQAEIWEGRASWLIWGFLGDWDWSGLFGRAHSCPLLARLTHVAMTAPL